MKIYTLTKVFDVVYEWTEWLGSITSRFSEIQQTAAIEPKGWGASFEYREVDLFFREFWCFARRTLSWLYGKHDWRHYILVQTTDASSLWPQLCVPHPPCGQVTIEVSVPTQWISSSQIRPLPEPKWADCGALTAVAYPSWRQTTLALFISQ